MKHIAKTFMFVTGILAAGLLFMALPSEAEAVDSHGADAMYRMYNPNTGEHFYTSNSYERDTLTSAGWGYEGVAWYAPGSSNSPVYRLYNPNAGDHHYTTNPAERDSLVYNGWNYEGIGWFSSNAVKEPLFRLYNPNAVSGAHHYTTKREESDHLVSLGWQSEGVSWYGMEREPAAKLVEQEEKGSYGFFEAMGSTSAVNVLLTAKYASYTDVGNIKDATDLDNMKNAIDYLDECNALRKQDGLPELKVSDYMMAVAQSDLNVAAYTETYPRQFNVGENIAWGFATSDPFLSWYDEEKTLYKGGIRDSGVSHYKNIINGRYTISGFAINQYGSRGSAYCQAFGFEENGMSVKDYKERFMRYYNKYK